MQISDYPFQDLPFSSLFKTYVTNFAELNSFYETNPFCDGQVSEHINGFTFAGDRAQTVRLLKTFNRPFNPDNAAIENMERLEDKEALAVVTGQQLGIYGGPLYTYFKILSTIHLAAKLEQQFNRPVIPVFWLADEDHDYEEVRTLYASNKKEPYHFELPPRSGHLAPVADQQLPEQLELLRSQIKDTLYSTDFSSALWELLDECFQPGETFAEAFGKYITRLFSARGLVLAGSNHRPIKEAITRQLQVSILKADEIRQGLEEQTLLLKDSYHQQVTLYDSNLFYLSEQEGRIKISREEDNWAAGNRKWNRKDLLDEIRTHPHKFSPNVFLRPVLQDALLPTVGYVAGPGEIAYYGQMKKMYGCFNMQMPVIYPRLSGTFIEPAIERISKDLPFEFSEYAGRIEDLETSYVNRTEEKDIEALFTNWKQKIDEISAPFQGEISEIDPTLEGASEKANTFYFNELEKLKTKVYRAVKKQDEIQLNRIHRVKANLFPNRTLQERVIAGISFMNKYGIDVWDRLLNELKNESFNYHKMIRL